MSADIKQVMTEILSEFFQENDAAVQRMVAGSVTKSMKTIATEFAKVAKRRDAMRELLGDEWVEAVDEMILQYLRLFSDRLLGIKGIGFEKQVLDVPAVFLTQEERKRVAEEPEDDEPFDEDEFLDDIQDAGDDLPEVPELEDDPRAEVRKTQGASRKPLPGGRSAVSLDDLTPEERAQVEAAARRTAASRGKPQESSGPKPVSRATGKARIQADAHRQTSGDDSMGQPREGKVSADGAAARYFGNAALGPMGQLKCPKGDWEGYEAECPATVIGDQVELSCPECGTTLT